MALNVLRYSENSDRSRLLMDHFFSGGQSEARTWIVADVRTKLRLQRQRLEAKGFVEGKAVLRASEFWLQLLKTLRPEMSVVSNELMTALIGGCLDELLDSGEAAEWLRGPGSAALIADYIRQLAPILATPGVSLEDWFDEPDQSSARSRWREWYSISEKIMKRLESEKVCVASWAPGLLVPVRDEITSVWRREVVVDLGAQLSQLEADLFLAIAKDLDVTVLRPSPVWENEYPEIRLASDWMLKNAEARGVQVREERKAVEESNSQKSAVVYLRFPAAAAEVKEAVSLVRGWIEAGVPGPSIAIAAADIEPYWPILSMHLECEGIPTSKSVVAPLHSFPDVMKWLARLRTRTSLPQTRDLEVDVFGESMPPLRFSDFEEIFSVLYSSEDLGFSKDLLSFYESTVGDRGRWPEDEMKRDEFLKRAVLLLRNIDDVERVTRVLKALLEECPPATLFKPSAWVRYVSEVAARTEMTIIPGAPQGVQVLGLGAVESAEATHVVVMGLHETALRSNGKTSIQSADIRSIERSTGLALEGEDRRRMEFQSRLILSEPRPHTVLMFSETDTSGVVQTPSWAWLAGAWDGTSIPEPGVPKTTRFDELGERALEDMGTMSNRERIQVSTRSFAKGVVKSLSPGSIEAISKCPLQFAFESVLGPRTQGALDFDPDNRKRGSLQHALLEKLGRTQFKYISNEEIETFIESARSEMETRDGRPIVRSDSAWRHLKSSMLRLARSVIDYESEERAKFPEIWTAAVELPIRGSVDSESGRWTDSEGSGAWPDSWPFNGRIDRLDVARDGRFVLIDYKSSVKSDSQGSWTKNQVWQPILYSMALEAGLFEASELQGRSEVHLKLAGAFLYDLKKVDRGKGLRIADQAAGLFEVPSSRSQQPATHAEIEPLFEEARERIKSVMTVLKEGEFVPTPFDPRHCESCRWVNACRFPKNQDDGGDE